MVVVGLEQAERDFHVRLHRGLQPAQYVLASTLAFAGASGAAMLTEFERAASVPEAAKRTKSLRLKAGMMFSRSITSRRPAR